LATGERDGQATGADRSERRDPSQAYNQFKFGAGNTGNVLTGGEFPDVPEQLGSTFEDKHCAQVIWADGALVAATEDEDETVLRIGDDDREAWPVSGEEILPKTPVGEQGNIVVGTEDSIRSIDSSSGYVSWDSARRQAPASELTTYQYRGERFVVYTVDETIDEGAHEDGSGARRPSGVRWRHTAESKKSTVYTSSELETDARGAPAIVKPDGHQPLAAVSTTDGHVVAAAKETNGRGWRSQDSYGLWTHPAATDGKVFVPAEIEDGVSLLVFDGTNGELLQNARLQSDATGITSVTDATLAVTDDTAVVRLQRDWGTDTVHGVSRASGEEVWEREISTSNFVPPVVSGQSVVVGGVKPGVVCLHRQTGERRWDQSIGGTVTASPLVHGERLFVPTNNGVPVYSSRVQPADSSTETDTQTPTQTQTETGTQTPTKTHTQTEADTQTPTSTVTQTDTPTSEPGSVPPFFPVKIGEREIGAMGAAVISSIWTAFIASVRLALELGGIVSPKLLSLLSWLQDQF
jgi:hypothetical protein